MWSSLILVLAIASPSAADAPAGPAARPDLRETILGLVRPGAPLPELGAMPIVRPAPTVDYSGRIARPSPEIHYHILTAPVERPSALPFHFGGELRFRYEWIHPGQRHWFYR